MAKLRRRKCKNCGEWFRPLGSTTEIVCSVPCAAAYGKVLYKKKQRQRKRDLKELQMTRGDYLQKAQEAFNAYIRERDKDRGCITCGKEFRNAEGYEKFDAGHFYSVGGYSGLRFNEDNVHGQCVRCNRHGHGKLQEYAIKLPQRIGRERFNRLKENRHQLLEMTKGEAKVLIIKYKEKLKQLKNERKN